MIENYRSALPSPIITIPVSSFIIVYVISSGRMYFDVSFDHLELKGSSYVDP